MKQIDITAIQEICGLRGKCKQTNFILFQFEKGHDIGETWLLGFLNEKDTLIAMYGEENYICRFCYKRQKGRDGVAEHCDQGYYNGYSAWIPLWQYHAQQTIGFSPTEILSYWRENKK